MTSRACSIALRVWVELGSLVIDEQPACLQHAHIDEGKDVIHRTALGMAPVPEDVLSKRLRYGVGEA